MKTTGNVRSEVGRDGFERVVWGDREDPVVPLALRDETTPTAMWNPVASAARWVHACWLDDVPLTVEQIVEAVVDVLAPYYPDADYHGACVPVWWEVGP